MEIRYKMTRQDVEAGLRIGLPRMSLGWWIFLAGNLIVFSYSLLLIFWAKGCHAHWPLVGPFPWHTFRYLLIGSCIGIAACFTFVLIPWHLTKNRTIKIDAANFTIGSKLGFVKLEWKQVLEILETGEYVCFCTGNPAVTVVPTSAFPNKEQAHAFAEQAGLYWRRATGRKDPPLLNSADVWPPPPSAANSQELDSRP